MIVHGCCCRMRETKGQGNVGGIMKMVLLDLYSTQAGINDHVTTARNLLKNAINRLEEHVISCFSGLCQCVFLTNVSKNVHFFIYQYFAQTLFFYFLALTLIQCLYSSCCLSWKSAVTLMKEVHLCAPLHAPTEIATPHTHPGTQ